MKTTDKILSAQQIKLADQFTITEENISSTDLMERSANACVVWIQQHLDKEKRFYIECSAFDPDADYFTEIEHIKYTAGWIEKMKTKLNL